MYISDNGIDFIKSFEGLKLAAYKDGGGVWTIGYGTTHYPSGYKVAEGDEITQEQADTYLMHDVLKAIQVVNKIKWQQLLTQNQYDALVSFQYNTGNLIGSTLCKKAIINPNDETIYKYNPEHLVDSCEFLRWVRDNGKIIEGLIHRRKAEADLYALSESIV